MPAGKKTTDLKQARLVKVGEALATGKCKTMRSAMLAAGLSETTALNPTQNGYGAQEALVAYEKKKLGGKGLDKAIEKAKEMVVEAISDSSELDYASRLKLSGWLVEHDLQRQKALGKNEEAGADPRDLVRFRLAVMRAIQKGIAIGLRIYDDDDDARWPAGKAQGISDALSEKMLRLAELLPEEANE